MTDQEKDIQRALGLLHDYAAMVVAGDNDHNMDRTPSHVEVVRDCVCKEDAEKVIRDYYMNQSRPLMSKIFTIDKLEQNAWMHTSFKWYVHKNGELVLLQDIDDEYVRKAVNARGKNL